jgi:hypothetical protein
MRRRVRLFWRGFEGVEDTVDGGGFSDLSGARDGHEHVEAVFHDDDAGIHGHVFAGARVILQGWEAVNCESILGDDGALNAADTAIAGGFENLIGCPGIGGIDLAVGAGVVAVANGLDMNRVEQDGAAAFARDWADLDGGFAREFDGKGAVGGGVGLPTMRRNAAQLNEGDHREEDDEDDGDLVGAELEVHGRGMLADEGSSLKRGN